MPNKSESTNQAQEGVPTAEGAAKEAMPAPQAAPNGKAAAPSLSGLRGEDYIKALAGQPLATVDVPLLPNERRGDWTRAKGAKIRVTSRQLSTQEGTSSAWLEGAHALTALVIELQRPGA